MAYNERIVETEVFPAEAPKATCSGSRKAQCPLLKARRPSNTPTTKLTLVAIAMTSRHIIRLRPVGVAKHDARRGQRRPHRRFRRLHHTSSLLRVIDCFQQVQVGLPDAVVPPRPGAAVASRHRLIIRSLVAHQPTIALIIGIAIALAPCQEVVIIVQITANVINILPGIALAAVGDAVIDVGAGGARTSGDGMGSASLKASQAVGAVGVGIAVSLRSAFMYAKHYIPASNCTHIMNESYERTPRNRCGSGK